MLAYSWSLLLRNHGGKTFMFMSDLEHSSLSNYKRHRQGSRSSVSTLGVSESIRPKHFGKNVRYEGICISLSKKKGTVF